MACTVSSFVFFYVGCKPKYRVEETEDFLVNIHLNSDARYWQDLSMICGDKASSGPKWN